uniref:Mitochondrial pyruvate carrier n=1 Tax=Helianthus annuus TaxID=4232 RepID=A0A251VMH9_HELAN
MATSKLQALWNHPAGPKTRYGWGRECSSDGFSKGTSMVWRKMQSYLCVHFWAPTFKWGISITNIEDRGGKIDGLGRF